ncbi:MULTISPECIES: T9SS type B sorting domain-containing protein [Arenibacter]|uniref:T9SS type B sorting domain-containing protein n=1 Tax=Arenibacter TaxID=178469 RepID=UPI0013000425|nr:MULTISPECIES: T9SS type B sorting domain-containing protein [Arenibacter]
MTIPKTVNTVALNCRVQTVVYDQWGNTSFPRCETAPPTSIKLRVHSTILRSNPQQTENFNYANKWQQSTDGKDWEDAISNVTGLSNQYIIPSSSTNYRFYRYVLIDEEFLYPLCTFDYQVFEIFTVPRPSPPLNPGNIEACISENRALSVTVDKDVEVDWYDAPSGGQLLLANSTTFLTQKSGTYYAEARALLAPLEPPVPGTTIRDTDSIYTPCTSYQRTPVSIILFDLPEVSDETLSFCENTTITLSAQISNVAYEWNTGETSSSINVNTPGIYTVKVTNSNGCSSLKTIALEQIDAPKVQTATSNEHAITIITAIHGEFEYSLDGFSYQDENTFYNIEGGLYKVYVREKNNCGLVTFDYVHLAIPKFFTPNGDGINDNFVIKGLENFQFSQISIFDRFGTLIKTSQNNPFEWDGTHRGQPLPATDYWFQINIEDTLKKGHFALKR